MPPTDRPPTSGFVRGLEGCGADHFCVRHPEPKGEPGPVAGEMLLRFSRGEKGAIDLPTSVSVGVITAHGRDAVGEGRGENFVSSPPPDFFGTGGFLGEPWTDVVGHAGGPSCVFAQVF